jgi:O-antigen ligase
MTGMRVRVRLAANKPGRTIASAKATRSAVATPAMGMNSEPASKWPVLWNVILCCTPAAFFLYTAQLFLAAVAFYSLLGLLVFYYLIRGKILDMTALLVGCIPMLMLLRPIFYHNSISVILAGTLLAWAIWYPSEIRNLMRDRLIMTLCLFALAYWWLSFVATGFYATNLRIFELTLGATIVFLLARFRSYLTPALWGIGAASGLIVCGIWRYEADRLGMVAIGSQRLGHPQQLGMACTLTLVLCLADRGRWLGLGRAAALRYLAAGGAATLLLLSTSRTSWLLALVGLAAMGFARGQRRYLMTLALLLTLVMTALLATGRGNVVWRYVDKVISEKRTWSQKTSGRYDMYAAFPDLFWQSPIVGLGPGTAETAYRNPEGRQFAMHSIFLHLGVELGIVGLLFLAFIYSAFVRRAWTHLRSNGEVVPLAFALACCVDALAHNSFNPLTGTFLGLALSDVTRRRMYRVVLASAWQASHPGACAAGGVRDLGL